MATEKEGEQMEAVSPGRWRHQVMTVRLGRKVPLVQGNDSEQLDAVQKEGVRRMRACEVSCQGQECRASTVVPAED
ncbi:hypothetical protein LEMLEM_LOCUS11513 [Lemmus lemmus]